MFASFFFFGGGVRIFVSILREDLAAWQFWCPFKGKMSLRDPNSKAFR